MAAACHNSFAAVDAIASEPADAPLLRPHAFKNRSLRGRAPSTTQFYSARDTRGWDRPEFVAGNRSSTALWGGGSPGATSSPSWRDSRGARTRRSFFMVALAVLSVTQPARAHLARLLGCPVTAWPPSGYRPRR